MTSPLVECARPGKVRQFSVVADNKVGRLHEVVCRLAQRGLHVLALSLLDTTDHTVVRLVVDFPEGARALFAEEGWFFSEVELVVVEIADESGVRQVTAALVEAEINIHYVYPFVCRPAGRPVLALRVEDSELAETVLRCRGLRVLGQHDLSR